jgi:predicted ribosome quality control (RQC) complex YloA/Tae2 family protein
MATVQGMSGLDIRAMTRELREKRPLWVGKIYQFDGKTIGIRLNGEEHARYQLLVEPGRRAHLTQKLPEPPKLPSGFAMLLRKYLSGGRVIDSTQEGLQRIFSLAVGKRNTTYHLIFELFDEGNIILCDEQFTIIQPLWHHRFKDREVVPGARYLFFGRDCTALSPDAFAELLKGAGRDLVRTLAVDCMLGGAYAEEVCRRAGIDKATPAASTDPNPVYDALHGLLSEVEQKRQPVITDTGCWPIPLEGTRTLQEFPSYNEALDAYYPLPVQEEKKEQRPRLSRDEIIRKQQQESIARFDQRISRSKRITELIFSHYSQIEEILAILDKASRSRSWQEIEHILRTSDVPSARSVVAIHPAEAAIELEIGERVKLYVHESVEANVGRYYDEMKKFRRKKEGAVAAMDRPLKVTGQGQKRRQPVTKPRWYHRFRWFYTSDGTLVIGGRDADQNEELVKKYMEGGDTFVHADVHGASVVIVKGATARIDEAAQFAASYSGAWRSGHFSADVYHVSPDQVSKTPPSGEYVSRGSFIIRGERTYHRNVPLGTAIGVQFSPETAVIGGPPSAVAARAKVWVSLKPGEFEPNDTAKRVVRALKQNLSDDEAKALRGIVTTERVAAFVPPGGSDIVEQHED